MKIRVIGAGPAGLVFATQIKLKRPEWTVDVVEKNKPNDIIGWGVVLPGQAGQHPANALSYVDTPEDLEPKYLEKFKIVHNDNSQTFDTGVKICGAERKGLVNKLRSKCESLGINIEYGVSIASEKDLKKEDYDIVVVSNGVSHSTTYYNERLKPEIDYGKNKYTWFGTPHLFKEMHLIFKQTSFGIFIAHAYNYSPEMSTCVVECTEQTYFNAGLDAFSEKESEIFIANVFKDELEAKPVITQPGRGWRNFMTISHSVARDGNVVLLGDTQQSGHFSIGQGTTMAVVEAQILVDELCNGADAESSLASYQAKILPLMDLFRAHANISRKWFETIDERSHLNTMELGKSFNERRDSLPPLPVAIAKALSAALGIPPEAMVAGGPKQPANKPGVNGLGSTQSLTKDSSPEVTEA